MAALVNEGLRMDENQYATGVLLTALQENTEMMSEIIQGLLLDIEDLKKIHEGVMDFSLRDFNEVKEG